MRITIIVRFIQIGLLFTVLVACSSQNSNSPTSTSGNESSGNLSLPDARRAASRFLTQATFGPRWNEIRELAGSGDYFAWINRQKNLPASTTLTYTKANGNYSNRVSRHDVWWKNVLSAEDQLRQRVAFALSEIFVVSDIDYTLGNAQYGISSYYDMLILNAFGNYRDLLEMVTLHPVMGVYLSMVQNEKADPSQNIRPDENYAREVLQLFSIGLFELDLQGNPTPTNNPRATYTQKIIGEFARVFTGWNYPNAGFWNDTSFGPEFFEGQMVPVDDYHDNGSKELLNGFVIPPGQSAKQDLQDALDNIFYHPNVGPFFSRLLIQRLVTSNPSPDYIERVASIFNNNGENVRGDLGAVVEAILMDVEARTGLLTNPDFGKIKEPIVKLAHFFRALGATPGSASGGVHATPDAPMYRINELLGQAPLQSKSVFNFFEPNHAISPGANLTAPEMAILTEANIAATHNNYHQQIYRFNNRSDLSDDNPYITVIDLDPLVELAGNTDELLDWYDITLMGGGMSSATRATLKAYIEEMIIEDKGPYARVQDSLFLLTNSPAMNLQN